MRFLIVNTDYPGFLAWLYAQNPGLGYRPYQDQLQARIESLFGVADFYSRNLRLLGHEAIEIHANNEFMQKAWAREHGIPIKDTTPVRKQWQRALRRARHIAAKTALRHLKPFFQPLLRSVDSQQSWFYDILSAQIKYYRPDVMLNQDMAIMDPGFLQEIKPHIRLLVGQIASPLPEKERYGCYDLVISSLPNFVDHFRQVGLCAELHRFAFEPHVLRYLRAEEAIVPVSFVGSVSWHHQDRIRLLENLCSRLDVKVWGQGIEGLPGSSPIRDRYAGRAWGTQMYQILHNSRITLNHHINISGNYANNMRLFEATGVGTLLVTDWKVNLHEMFEPGKEVVAYRSPEECVELVQYYLEHEDERELITRSGQERTLREHTYYQRMQELVDIIHRHL